MEILVLYPTTYLHIILIVLYIVILDTVGSDTRDTITRDTIISDTRNTITRDIIEDREEAVGDDCKQVCHTIHIKDCTITMKKVLIPVKVKKCVAKEGGEGGQCVGGVMKKCSIR